MLSLLYSPSNFFEKIKEESIITTIFYYLFGVFLMVSFAAAVIYLFKLKTIDALVYYLSILLFAFMLVGLSLLFSYVIYFILGKYSAKNAFKIISYSFYPFYLFGWTIIFGGVISAVAISLIYVWATLLTIIGVSKLFDTKRTEAAVCTILFFQIVAMIGIVVFLR